MTDREEHGWYETEQSYQMDLLKAAEEKLEIYIKFTEQALFGSADHAGVEPHRFTDLYPKEVIGEYERMQDGIRKKIRRMSEWSLAAILHDVMIPLEYLYRIFGAEDFLKHCVLLALAPELDSRFGIFFAKARENSGSSRPTVDFCIRTYTLKKEKRESLLRNVYEMEPQLALFFVPDSRGMGCLARELRLDKRILHFLFQVESDDPLIQSFSRIAYAGELEDTPMVIRGKQAERLAQLVSDKKRKKSIYYIYGCGGVGRKFLIRHVHRRLNQLCLMVDAAGLIGDQDFHLVNGVIRETLIRQAGLCIWNFERLEAWGSFQIHCMLQKILEQIPAVFILSDRKWPYEKGSLPGGMAELELVDPSMEERLMIWQEAMRREHLEYPFDLEALSGRFSFTPEQIMESVREAAETAVWEETTVSEDHFYRACRNQVSHHLGDRALQVKGSYDWEDLVLPPQTKQMLKNACNQIEHYHTVYETWGFNRKMAYGRGVSMLFYGPPGTGKTMGAQVIAKTLHLELYKVDLSSVMSKYIGETEKNLGGIFQEVKKSQSILFFDEADALFGKRSEVKDAQDKYANAETAYLLQKMEEYEGIIILATNFLQNFDEAFKRRIKFLIEFPLPDGGQRLEIWKRVYPEEAPLGEDLDFEYLARQFEVSGSNIRNIAVAAAFLAASENSSIHMQHILFCLWEEIKKSGKLLQKGDFGEYYYLLEGGVFHGGST